MELDFETLMNLLKEKYPYSMLRWVEKTYWITDDTSEQSIRKEET